MRFGIEIEFAGSTQNVLDALYRAGLGSSRSMTSYMQHSQTHWVVKTDASVPGGGELVGPPLQFENEAHTDGQHEDTPATDCDRCQVTRAIACLVEAGGRTTSSAGIHIHMESSDLTAEQLSNLARTYVHFEDAIYRLATSGWQRMRPSGYRFAAPLNDRQRKALAAAKTGEQLRAAYYGPGQVYASGHSHGSRYTGLNLHSHFYRGTVEWRMFNSSVNAMRVQTYLSLVHAFMVDAKNGKKRSIAGKAMRLGDMAAGTLDPAKALFRLLSVTRYEAGQSLTDYRNTKKLWKDSRPQTMPGYQDLPHGWSSR